MADWAQTLDFVTATTAIAMDGLTVSITNASETDVTTQRAFVVANLDDSSAAGTVETIAAIENRDVNETVTNGLLVNNTGAGTMTNAINITQTAGTIGTAINIGNNVGTGISIGTGVTTGISVGSGGITIAAGDLAVNSDSITSDGASLGIQVNGASTGNVQIGADGAGSTTPDLLVLDVKSDDGDPTGTNGAVYYNAYTDKFRCYQNSVWTDCINPPPSAGNFVSYATDFLGAAGATTTEAVYPWDFAVISSGTQAKIAGEANHPGILRISSSTSANSGGYVEAEATSFLIDGGEQFECVFEPRVASNTNTTIRMGFLDSLASTDETDGVYFELPAGSLAIVGKTANGSTRSTSATIATLVVNTWYKVKLVVNTDATLVTFYVYGDDGTLLGSQSLNTNIPTTATHETGNGIIATNSGTAATLLAYFDYMSVYMTRKLTRGGADLAEVYGSNDSSLEPGDVVSIDPNLKDGVKKSEKSYDSSSIGIVSTQPGLILGDSESEGIVQVLVALAGHVPVKVSLENGSIAPGDLLTPSSTPGVAMKATKAGIVIGQALTMHDGNQPGFVVAFIKNSYANGSKLNDVLSGFAFSDSQENIEQKALVYFASNQNQLSQATDLSEVFTDRVSAGLEVITPKLTADEIFANKIHANQIEGLTFLANQIISEKFTQAQNVLDAQTATGSAVLGDTETNLTIDSLIANKGLTVYGLAKFMDGVTFSGAVSYLGDVFFEKTPTFNKDTAGFAIIKEGSREVYVAFENE
jgi:hypothetical protein